MNDPPPDLETGDDAGGGPDRGSTTSTPRWVKVFGLVALAVILLIVVLLVVGGGPGGHGPGRHGGGGDVPPTGATEGGGHTPPPGVDHGGQPR